MLNRRTVLAGAAAALASPLARATVALPETLRVVVPFPAGGALDGSPLVHARSSTRSSEAVSSLPQPWAINALSCWATAAVNGTGTPDLRAASSTSPKSL